MKSPIRRVWEWLRPPTGPKLRNKPGGMAWIVGVENVSGEHVLNGRAVKTLYIDALGMWRIDPPQDYMATTTAYYPMTGNTVLAGLKATAIALVDDRLEPWKEDGITESEVSALYQPSPEFADQVHLAVGVTSAMCGSKGRTA